MHIQRHERHVIRQPFPSRILCGRNIKTVESRRVQLAADINEPNPSKNGSARYARIRYDSPMLYV